MNQENRTIGQIVAEDYRTAQVFRQFGLDFCCGGDRTIEEACRKKGLEPAKVQQALEQISATEVQQDNYNMWSPDFLIDYIVNNHHQFCRGKLPEINQYANKVARVHGDRHPELHEINRVFTDLHGEMIEHLNKEEQILFPYVKKLVEAEEEGGQPDRTRGGKASDPIALMEEEHEEAGAAMEKIRELSDNFTPPEDACTTYQLLFQNLEAFEKDLHKHVHLENNILFPKALELEESVRRN